MAVEWSGSGPRLSLVVDRDATAPLRSQVEDQLRSAVRDGRLRPGEKVPSTRELAAELGLSRGLLQECYAQLIAEGYLTSRAGSATRVADRAAATDRVEQASASAAVPEPPRRLIADFEAGVPDLASFPREDWAWAVHEACRTAPNGLLDYGDGQGAPVAREVVAAYLRRVRAAHTDADAVVMCQGYAQGVSLLLKVLAARGVRRVAVEDPGSLRGTTRAAREVGLDVVPVRVDGAGIDVEALARSRAEAVLVTPAHQWPTGVVMSPERRLQLVEWAADRDGLVIEDDYDAEFRYDRDPVGSLQGLAHEHVANIGTVSKSLTPGLRLGWVVCPAPLVGAMVAQKALADRGSPVLDQLALARLLESGRFDRHLRRMRVEYSARRQALVEAVADVAPDCRVTGLAAGFHAVLHLPSGSNESEVIERAAGLGVGLHGMSPLRSGNSPAEPALVVGFGNVRERVVREGIRRIASLLQG